MIQTVVLDTGPLGLLAYSRANPTSEACNAWMSSLLSAGATFIIPEIADYELRRELLRMQQTKGVLKLESLKTVHGFQYLPINTRHMRTAAALWAEARRAGRPTSDAKAIDGDVILAAQALSLMDGDHRVITASTNAVHLSRFVPTAEWGDIRPETT
jgi:predicted nucleic acid-binding protein